MTSNRLRCSETQQRNTHFQSLVNMINSFHANVPFPYPLKKSEKKSFSGVFRCMEMEIGRHSTDFKDINPLRANLTKWSNTLKQFTYTCNYWKLSVLCYRNSKYNLSINATLFVSGIKPLRYCVFIIHTILLSSNYFLSPHSRILVLRSVLFLAK